LTINLPNLKTRSVKQDLLTSESLSSFILEWQYKKRSYKQTRKYD